MVQGAGGLGAKDHRRMESGGFRTLKMKEQPSSPGSGGQDGEPREGVSAIWPRYSEGQSYSTPRNHNIASPRSVSSKIWCS